MGENEKTDVYWKAFLSKQAYQTLRQGQPEESGTGKYVHTKNRGMYQCVGCAVPLFHSSDKIDDGSGYATFRAPTTEDVVQLHSTYTQQGDTKTGLICRECGGWLGSLSGDSIQSDEDLVQGTVQRTYHISSRAVRLKKAVTPRNYPFTSFIILAALAAGGFFAWSWGMTLIDTARLENTADVIPMWIGDTPLQAKVVHLENISETGTSLVSKEHVLLVDVAGAQGIPRVRFANQPMDILWLDASFVVVSSEQNRPAEMSALDIPASARYMLIVQQGFLPERSFIPGQAIIITDRSALL